MQGSYLIFITGIVIIVFSLIIAIIFLLLIQRIIQNFRLQKEFQAKMQRAIVEAQEKERELLSDNLHDDFGPQLGILLKQLETAEKRDESYSFSRNQLEKITLKIEELAEDIRKYSSEIFPTQFKKLGLIKSLENNFIDLESENKIIEFRCEVQQKLHFSLIDELALYRTVNEAVSNIMKHSRPTALECIIEIVKHKLSIGLTHNGLHFSQAEFMEEAQNGAGKGCSSILNRTLMLGGTVTIERVFNELTYIEFIIPLPHHAETH